MAERTTVRLSEDLLRKVKKLAAETDRTMTAVIEDALRAHLARRSDAISSRKSVIPTDGRAGLLPGVSLDDGRALRRSLDEGRPVDELR